MKKNVFTYLFLGLTVLLQTVSLHAGSRKRYKRIKQKKEKEQQEKKAAEKKTFLNTNRSRHIDIEAAQINNSPKKNTASFDLAQVLTQNPVSPHNQKRPEVNDTLEVPNEMQAEEKKLETKGNVITVEQEPEEDVIELHFENADLKNFIKQIEDIFEVTFITDDALEPVPKDGKALKGNKISFKTHRPLSRQQAWNLFITFLEIAGFALIPQPDPRIYRIASIPIAQRAPIPSYIGVDYQTLPDNDQLIRYVYFIENTSPETIKNVIDPLRSPSSAPLIILNEHKAFILTDKAYNVRKLMEIVKELDKVSMPQAMSVLKLRNADAKQVKELYETLLPQEDKGPRFFARKKPTSLYFPENTRIIAEPRTNALILLGPKDAIAQIEEFIKKHIDVELDQPYSPLYVYQLKYADAVTIADIMNNVTQFGKDTEAGKSGGIRGVDQYLKPMAFVPEKETNRIIIKAHYEDYLKAKAIIEKLDEAQPQVAIEVLILSVQVNNSKELGTQLRSKDPSTNDGLLGKNVTFQTSGLFAGGDASGIQERGGSTTSGTNRLLGNLLNLVTNAGPGNTVLSLGKDIFGVWGIFQMLQTVTNTEILSNPFLLATNKTPAVVSLGEERRIQTSTVVGTGETQSFGADDAKLEVKIVPQINSDGMIVLDLDIIINDFTNAANPNDATKSLKEIKTSTIVADKEVLALGGLIRNNTTDNMNKTPLLGDVPVLGWLFKNRQKQQRKENLLILISSRIIEPLEEDAAREYTHERIVGYHGTLDEMNSALAQKDPIHHMFFRDFKETDEVVENFLFERSKNSDVKNKRLRKRKNTRKVVQNNHKKQKQNNHKEKQKRVIAQHQQQPLLPTQVPMPTQKQTTAHTQQAAAPQEQLQRADETLQKTIAKKKRTQLSLSNFLPSEKQEVHA